MNTDPKPWILSNYIIRDGLSQKTISRYCPFKQRHTNIQRGEYYFQFRTTRILSRNLYFLFEIYVCDLGLRFGLIQRLNIELDLYSLFGLLCVAVLIG
jgi:hypothetical protein